MKALRIFLLAITAFIFVLSFVAYAGVPQKINYQGKITTPAGALIDDTLSMVFKIYDASTGGNTLWSETQSSVVVDEGIFSVLLGDVTSIPDSVFDGSVRYLGLKVGDDSEMTPRKPIVSTGYAFHSKHADTDDDWTASDTNIYRLGGNVGIGKNDPTSKLDVVVEGGNVHSVTGIATGSTYCTGVSGVGVSNGVNADAIGVYGQASKGIGGGKNLYGGYFKTLSLSGADKYYGVYAWGVGGNSTAAYGVYARASGSSGTNYAIYVDGPAADSGYVGYFDGGKSYFSGKVGIGTNTPQGALDVTSISGAFIVPRMSTAQRNALTAVNGMIIYNNTTNEFNFYENGSWVTK